jgi:hypothetical protein
MYSKIVSVTAILRPENLDRMASMRLVYGAIAVENARRWAVK